VEFVNSEDHTHEVIYIRIKKEGDGDDAQLANLLTEGLKPWLVQKSENLGDHFTMYKMNDLQTDAKQTGAKVVLLAYKWNPPAENKHIFPMRMKAKK
jgi:hypothetical protein